MIFDVEKLRKDTPGCAKTLHFNNAGASLPTSQVLNSVIDYLKEEAMNGGYETADRFEIEHRKVYEHLARLINSKTSEIAIVDSATRAWDVALSSVPFKKGDRILTSSSEYVSNYLALLQFSKKFELSVEFIPNNEHGETSIDALRKMVDEKVKLIAITHVPSTNGMVNSLQGISEISQSVGAFFLLDACQSIGQMEVDVQKIGCDFLAATGRKFLRAPRGTGFLYVKESTLKKYNLEPLFVDFGGATMNFDGTYSLTQNAQRYENFEASYAARIGLGVAAEYAYNLGLKNIEGRVQKLSHLLREELREIPQVQVHDTGIKQSAIVTFSIDGVSTKGLAQGMRGRNINISTARREFALDLHERKIDSVLRASLHYYNTEEEIKTFIHHLQEIHRLQ